MGNLVIYRASAGTGKTFTLAVEYIKLLVQSPTNYRRILAVTFTNKATAEMKERILSQLYGIGHGLAESEDYYRKVEEDLQLSEAEIRKNALTALHNILHDFSFFHVETIDSFFQTVMRNLAHELQLSTNLAIDLDQKTAISEAVDEMMDQLTPGTPEIEWIMEAIADQIDENKHWNISRPLKDFAKNLFAETYQKHSHQLDSLLSNEYTQAYKH
ncbi:MAG: UvrD-helicase domain-containing protein, partial [Bacteroidaceae bacterium]|nr:UvrD-helicase domain-containing protein [Bacteroidaceae bacterium]